MMEIVKSIYGVEVWFKYAFEDGKHLVKVTQTQTLIGFPSITRYEFSTRGDAEVAIRMIDRNFK
jgi:hypothetical protein